MPCAQAARDEVIVPHEGLGEAPLLPSNGVGRR